MKTGMSDETAPAMIKDGLNPPISFMYLVRPRGIVNRDSEVSMTSGVS
jgi:hypothetical protein